MPSQITTSLVPNWPQSLRALRHRHFRVMWITLLASAVGTWMQIVAQSLLVLKLTHGSAFALGCVSLSQALAFLLFALVGGGFADRVNRRKLLLVTQASLMLLAATLGWLTQIGAISVPLIALFAFLSGALLSFDQPARAAFLSTLVDEKDLLNAISLQSAVFNGAAVAGPALAGLTADLIGLPANFFLNAFSFSGVLLALFSIPNASSSTSRHEKLIAQILMALRSVGADSVLLPLLVVYGTLLFAGPSLPLILPVLAEERLHVGPAVLGLLFSAAGIGAVIGVLILGTLRAAGSWSVLVAVACWCLALVLTGISRVVQLTFCTVILLGASQSVAGAICSTLLQTRVPPQQRGRVMSLNTLLLMGVRPLGDFPAGAAIALLGAPIATVASAALVALTALLVFRERRKNS